MPLKIGFVGYSAAKFDVLKCRRILFKIFNEIMDLHDKDIEIVSGATMYGVIKEVYFMAARMGYKTSGFMCKEGHDCEVFPTLEHLYVVGDNWGDESEAFIDYIDVLYRIGGGPQSLKEVEMAKTKGIPVHEYELEKLE